VCVCVFVCVCVCVCVCEQHLESSCKLIWISLFDIVKQQWGVDTSLNFPCFKTSNRTGCQISLGSYDNNDDVAVFVSILLIYAGHYAYIMLHNSCPINERLDVNSALKVCVPARIMSFMLSDIHNHLGVPVWNPPCFFMLLDFC